MVDAPCVDTPSAPERVSIVVPTRDRAARLERTVRNLLCQTHPDFEVVVSDDGSRDATAEVLARIGDDRLVVVSADQSSGVSTARNRGIAVATGRWVAVCDDDDLWHPDKLAVQTRSLQRSGARWGFCGAVSVTDDLQTLSVVRATTDRFGDRLVQGNPVPGGCSSAVVERDLLHEVDGFDPELSMFADYDLWIRLHAIQAPVAVPECLVAYVEHRDQMTRTRVIPAIDELRRLRAKHRSRFDGPRDASPQSMDRWLVTKLRTAGLRGEAVRYVLAERRAFPARDRVELLGRALASRPSWRHRPAAPAQLHPTVEAVLGCDHDRRCGRRGVTPVPGPASTVAP